MELCCANKKTLQKTHLAGKDNEMHLLVLFFQISAIHHFNNMSSTVSIKEVSPFFFFPSPLLSIAL